MCIISKKFFQFPVQVLAMQICAFFCSILGGTGERRDGKFLQKRVPNHLPFPCPKYGHRSITVPQSVHQLRPGLMKMKKKKILWKSKKMKWFFRRHWYSGCGRWLINQCDRCKFSSTLGSFSGKSWFILVHWWSRKFPNTFNATKYIERVQSKVIRVRPIEKKNEISIIPIRISKPKFRLQVLVTRFIQCSSIRSIQCSWKYRYNQWHAI